MFDLSTLSLAQLADMYNGAIEAHSLPVKPTKKFKDKPTGIARVEHVMGEYALEVQCNHEGNYVLVSLPSEKDATEDAEEFAAEMNAGDVADEDMAAATADAHGDEGAEGVPYHFNDGTNSAGEPAGGLTPMQYALMNRIAHDQYNTTNGATPTSAADVATWLFAADWAADLGLTEQQVGGVLTSLENAEYVSMYKGDESTVNFTEAGFAAWQAASIAAVTAKLVEAGTIEAPKAKKHAGPKGEYADEQVITVLVANPKRVGCKAWHRFEKYATGQTVRQALDAGLTREDFRWDTYRGHITIE